MLEAGDRGLLLDALRPPDGYRFDQGIGTTYSLLYRLALGQPNQEDLVEVLASKGRPDPDTLRRAMVNLSPYLSTDEP